MNPKKIGERLIAARGEKARETVASDIGVSYSALAMYEQGNRIPCDEVKLALAEYFGLSIQELFFDP